MNKYIGLILFISFNCSANSDFYCSKGKISIGDSFEKYENICGKHKGKFEAGMRNLKSFKTFEKIYPDKSKVRFLFIDKKLAFIFT